MMTLGDSCIVFFYPFPRLSPRIYKLTSGQAHGQWETLHAPDTAPRRMEYGHIRALSSSSLFITRANDRWVYRYNSCDFGTFPELRRHFARQRFLTRTLISVFHSLPCGHPPHSTTPVHMCADTDSYDVSPLSMIVTTRSHSSFIFPCLEFRSTHEKSRT